MQFISPPEEVGEFLLHLLKWLIVLYWFLNLLCCLIIARAFHNISVREKKHELLVQQMSFLQKQLEYTTEMEQEYRSVRKWNHDMENHLFSLNYLIRAKNIMRQMHIWKRFFQNFRRKRGLYETRLCYSFYRTFLCSSIFFSWKLCCRNMFCSAR